MCRYAGGPFKGAPHDSTESGALSFLHYKNPMRLQLLPPPLAANCLVRTLSSHVARTVGRREDEFALEGRALIA
jgi:hypothetical protein